MLLFNTAPDRPYGKSAVLFLMREMEATEKPTENTAAMVANQWRVILSCELQTLLSEKNSLLHTFPQGMQSFSHVPMQTYPCSMPRRNIYRNRELGGSAGAAASCNRTRVITRSASAYSDLVSE